MKLDINDVERAVGKAALALRVGPADVESKLYDGLAAVGVLERKPASWPVADEIAALPWGAGAVSAPDPKPQSGIEGPWPQDPVVHPFFPSPVLKIDRADVQDHVWNNVTRFMGQILMATPKAALRARLGRRIVPVTDARFEELVTGTTFAQFLLPIVAPRERQAFADDLKAHPDARFGTIDLSGFAHLKPLPGVFAAPTVVLLRERSETEWAVVAIRCGEHVFHPEDGARWDLAKYFVLQGAQCLLVHIAHPRLHFPMDAVNAFTQSLLPSNHRLKRLLAPHFQYTLGLHKAVIHHQRGAIHNNQRELSVGFTFETASMHEGVVLGMHGRGDEAYPSYDFWGVHLGTHTTYGRYRQAWYQHILEFTRKIANTFDVGDPDVTRWADAISPIVVGFPDGMAIWGEDVLAQTLATVIATVSVFHTADHDSHARIPTEELPWRLRQAPPDEAGPVKLDLQSLVLPEDHFRAILTHRLYSKPAIRSKLSSVKYSFRMREARDAADEFVDGFSALDGAWEPHGFATASGIATSVQY